METPGVRSMGIGALICVVGLLITIGTYSAVSRSGGHYVVAYGAVLAGGFQFIVGLFRFLAYSFQGPLDKALAENTVAYRALLAAFVGAARTPSNPSENESAAITSILKQVADATVTTYTIRAVATALQSERGGAPGYLRAKVGELTQAIKELIVKGSLLVMTSDGPRADLDEKIMAQGMALGLSEAQVREIVDAMFAPPERMTG
ncbi:MAG TPA: hypothetical protein VF601_20550 [Beijerinckiaceae bacterium]|jgi:hypothetical protein